MAIYTRFGMQVKLTEARLIPVWIEHQGHRIKWHYTPKEPTSRTKELSETPIWHVKAEYNHGDDMDGCLLHQGRWIVLSDFVADGGWAAIQEECERLNPGDAWKYKQWNAFGDSKARDLFSLEPKKNIA